MGKSFSEKYCDDFKKYIESIHDQLCSEIQEFITKNIIANDMANRSTLVNAILPVVERYMYNFPDFKFDLYKGVRIYSDDINDENTIKENKIAVEGRLYIRKDLYDYAIEIFNEKFNIN